MPEGTSACAGRYPHCTWRNLCLAGTVTQNLADHVPVAWGWGEDVQALGSGGRGVWATASVRRAQAQSCGADRPELPDYRYPGGRSGRLLDPPGAAVGRDREPRSRRRLDPDLAPASVGEDRSDRWRDTGAHPDGLQAWRAAGVFDGQGADAAGGGPAACLPRAPDADGRASEARQPDQRAAVRPGGVRLRTAAQGSA